MHHFANCHTLQEIKDEYRRQAMKLHPDKGGTNEDFRDLQNQYEYAISNISTQPKLPEYFRPADRYTYLRREARYTHCDNWYYYFWLDSGCIVQIDFGHVNLIKMEYKQI